MSSPADSQISNVVVNVPNVLTAIRLLLAIVVFALIPLEQYQIALVLFVIAAATDWMDGYWARRTGQVTKLGRIFDPFVDKIIICGVFILLAVAMTEISGGIRGWMAVVVVGREMLVTALRSFIEQSGGDFSASMSGKLKMVFQCAAAILGLIALQYSDVVLPMWMAWALPISVWLAVVSTVYSGVEYMIAAAKFFQGQ